MRMHKASLPMLFSVVFEELFLSACFRLKIFSMRKLREV